MRTLLCIALMVFSATLAAQDFPAKPQKAHEALAREAGTWDCEVSMFLQGPDAPPAEFKGVEVDELVSGDMYLRTSFKCPMGDLGEFEGHGLIGYDPRSKKYVGTWVDNFSAVPTQYQAEWDEGAKTMTAHSTVVDGNGQELKQKQVTTWVDESTKKFAVFLLVEAGGREMELKLMEMTARRRK